MNYLLLGSLGNITRPLAQQLIAAGHDVTIITHSEKRQPDIAAIGATSVVGSIEDAAFLAKTFKGEGDSKRKAYDAIYAMIPPNYAPTEWKAWIAGVGKKYADAIKAAGIKKVVFLSSIGAHLPEGCGPVSGIHFAEEALKTLKDVDILFLRPAYFYYNLFGSAGMIKHAGFYGNNFGSSRKVIMVYPADIAAVAGEELLKLSFKGHSVRYIASDERTSPEIAATLGAAIGKPDLRYVEFNDEDTYKGMVQAGLSEEVARNYTEMGTAIRSGRMFEDYEKHKPVLSPTKLESFAKEFAAAYERS